MKKFSTIIRESNFTIRDIITRARREGYADSDTRIHLVARGFCSSSDQSDYFLRTTPVVLWRTLVVYLLTPDGCQAACQVTVKVTTAWEMNEHASRIAEDVTGLRVDWVFWY